MDYEPLVKVVLKHFCGDIDSDELNKKFLKWAKKNNYPLPTMIRFLKDTFGNEEGNIVPLVNETETEIYYNDSLGRYCYLSKIDDKDDFEFI